MKRIANLALLATAALLAACATTPPNTDIPQLSEARSLIAKAKAAGAERCAPERQAEAVAKLYEAAHEFSEGNIHPDEQAELLADSVKAAKQAYAQTVKGHCQPEVIALEGVHFKTNSAELTPNSTAILDHAVQVLNKRSDIKVEVAAHTDSRGSAAYNQALSERRAKSVMDYLTAHGVAASRLSSHGYGESRPIASNATPEGRAKNRRVELIVR